MRPDDLSEMLNELPMEDLATHVTSQEVTDEAMNSPRGNSQKREASSEAVGHEDSRPRNSNTDILFCHEVLSSVPCDQIPSFDVGLSAETHAEGNSTQRK